MANPSAFTPGPWTYDIPADLEAHGLKGDGILRNATNHWIADVFINIDDDISPEEGMANRYLIAAAPELLAAATRVLGLMEELAEPSRKTSAGYIKSLISNGETFRFMRAAIAKATGVQS